MRVSFVNSIEKSSFPDISIGQTLMFGYFLFSITWVNLLVKFLYGVPFLSESTISLEYYNLVDGYPFSIAQLFLYLSFSASLVTLCIVWMTSAPSQSKWRQRTVIVLFGLISILFSIACLKLEPIHLEEAKWSVQKLLNADFNDYPTKYRNQIIEDRNQVIINLEANILRAQNRL